MSKLKKIADMRHRIVIEQPVEVSDGQGGQDVSWTTFATVWASVQPKKGFEILAGQRIENRMYEEIVIRDLPGIDATMRIQFDNRVLMIQDIDRFENSRRFFMSIRTIDKVGS